MLNFVKRLFLLLLLLTLYTLSAQERVLIVTESNESFSIYEQLIMERSKDLYYFVDVVVEDDLEYYLDSSMSHLISFSIYLDNSRLEYKKISGFRRGLLPPLEITQKLLSKYFIENRVAMEFPLYISGIIAQPEEILLLQELKIPTLYIQGVIEAEDIISLLTEEMVDSNKHYFVYSIFGRVFYVDDLTSILINVIFISLVLLLINLFSKRVKFHLKHNRKYMGTLPIKILSIIVFYYISTLVIDYIIEYAGSSDIIYNYPKSFFIIKHLILFFIYGISFQIVKDAAFSKSPHFYSFMGLFGGIFFYFFLLIIYQPLAIYQIWFIMCSILYIFVPVRGFKRVMLIISPLVLLLVFYDFFTRDHKEFIDLFITSRYRGNLLSSFIIMPYVFMQESFFRFSHRRQKFITHTKDIVVSLLTLTTIFTMLAILLELNKI